MQNPAEHQRQVHLDFHTSPLIPDVGTEFDATEFARTLKAAHVNSVTIFAKCHHGMCYYPTTTGTQHPALAGRDLLGEQIEALHREGIRCPIYTTVGWEEDAAAKHPEWRQMRHNGTFARCGNPDPSLPAQPAGWWFMNFLHPEYQDYMEAHVRELLARYEVDGLFFDIVFLDGNSCWSEASLQVRRKHGLTGRDLATQVRFQNLAQDLFMRRFSDLVRGIKPSVTVFFNATHGIFTDASLGMRHLDQYQTHWEVESLPSGFWGYAHFPRMARALEPWGKPWLGMTGRFQKMWGDFGGLKPQAALEYECFRSQAFGGGNSVGDQLPPRGRLDAGAYRLIGDVYEQVAAAEPFYAGSTRLPQIGIIAPGDAEQSLHESDKSLEGAIQMCDEAHYDCAVLDDSAVLTGFPLLLLPDSVVVTETLRERLQTYLLGGGKLLVSGQSGFTASGASAIPGLGLHCRGEVEKFPTYWRAHRDFAPDLAESDRVVYQPGLEVEAPGCAVLVERVLPYFRRTDLTYSSHFQAPPVAQPSAFPAAVQGSNFIYFADPIFREYRQAGNIAVRDGWRLAVQRLIGPPNFGHGLPSTVLSVPRRRGKDLILTLLHYIPTRKALDIDMIEERSSFAGETLKMPDHVTEVRVFGTDFALPPTGPGEFSLPMAKGRLLLEVPGYFS